MCVFKVSNFKPFISALSGLFSFQTHLSNSGTFLFVWSSPSPIEDDEIFQQVNLFEPFPRSTSELKAEFPAEFPAGFRAAYEKVGEEQIAEAEAEALVGYFSHVR